MSIRLRCSDEPPLVFWVSDAIGENDCDRIACALRRLKQIGRGRAIIENIEIKPMTDDGAVRRAEFGTADLMYWWEH